MTLVVDLKQTYRMETMQANDLELDQTITRRLLELTYGNYGGSLFNDLVRVIRNNIDSLALVVYHEDEIVGWALMADIQREENGDAQTAHMQFFVDHDYRRQGIASWLLESAAEHCPEVSVGSGDRQSSSFFHNLQGVYLTLNDTGWYDPVPYPDHDEE